MKINNILKELPREKLREYKVGLIYHFGSTASGYALKFSDIDLGIVFTDTKVLENSLKIYNEMYQLFTDLLRLPYDLDIVLLQQTSFSFQYQVVYEGEVIFEESPIFRMDYEEYVMKMYFDFKYIDKIFSEVIREVFR